jgi:predicted PurR-regulated permease PerM
MSRSQPADPFGLALTWGGLALLVYLVYLVVAPFLPPLGWASVFAILFYPLHTRLALRWSPGRAALASTLIIAVVLIAPMVLLVTSFTQEALQAAGTLQNALADGGSSRIEVLWHQVEASLPARVRTEVTQFANDAARAAGSFVITQSGLIAKSAVGFVTDLVIALFATFFLLRDAGVIMRGVRRLLPMDHAAREELIARIQELIAVGVVSSLVVAAVQGFLGGVSFALLGLSEPIFWGVVMGLCCLLPFGAWVIWMPTALLLVLSGDVTRALILAGLGVGIVSSVDNVLRPILLSGRAKMNGLVILVSLLGGVAVFGLLGLVLGPIIVVTALALVKTYVDSPSRERLYITDPLDQ